MGALILIGLAFSCMTLKMVKHYLKTARFLKYVWPFPNIFYAWKVCSSQKCIIKQLNKKVNKYFLINNTQNGFLKVFFGGGQESKDFGP